MPIGEKGRRKNCGGARNEKNPKGPEDFSLKDVLERLKFIVKGKRCLHKSFFIIANNLFGSKEGALIGGKKAGCDVVHEVMREAGTNERQNG